METQNQVSVQVQAESAKSQFPTIKVLQFLDARSGNTKGRNVQVQWITKREQSQSRGITSFFLGSMAVQNDEKRTAIQFMGNDVIEQLGLKEGINLNEAMKAAGQPALRIAISEITESDYNNLDQGQQIPYQIKINPSTDEVLAIKGEAIYRKTYLADLGTEDDYLQHDGSTVAPKVEGDHDDLPV